MRKRPNPSHQLEYGHPVKIRGLPMSGYGWLADATSYDQVTGEALASKLRNQSRLSKPPKLR